VSDNGFRVRTMRREEIARAVDWAAAEGWNPGLADADCFLTVDRDGFLNGEQDGAMACSISAANYDEQFAFLGFYIVRPDLRGKGFGRRIWQAAIEHAGARTIGLDGVVEQQANYRKSGFDLAYNNIRFGGEVGGLRASCETMPLAELPLELIEREDASVFPAPRSAFLRAWIAAPGHLGRALLRNGTLAGWGVIRPCRHGRKIGPLVADERAAAELIFAALVGPKGGEVFLDVPEPNHNAIALAEAHGLAPVFETARMYSGPIRPVALERLFGVTTFELG
jgi:GNAT superfamily N-acetyltransferase